ncbi:MAG: PspC domain-containing protein [Bacteroidota bacterium]|jgi:phage shock protein PspC (stress-responsive transcriptional regulator)
MKKTVTVNIGGIVFHIEETAYEQLQNYLSNIKSYFTLSDGRDEIIQDIETRIAEMFSEKMANSRMVVTDADVEEVMQQLGKPSEVAGADDASNNNNENTKQDRAEKKLFRDPDDKIVGGVCSGVAHYFGIQPLWLRLLLLISLIYGAGLLLYFILWIVIPKAKNASEKLAMKGKPINLDTIKETIEDDVTDLTERVKGKKPLFEKGTSRLSRFVEDVISIAIQILTFIAKFFGAVVSIVLFILLFGLMMALLGITGALGDANVPVFLSNFVLSPTQMFIAITGIAFMIGIPLLFILYRVLHYLFNIKKEPKPVRTTAGVLWIIGLIMVVFIALSVSKNFRSKQTASVTMPLQQPKGDTLYLNDILVNQSASDIFIGVSGKNNNFNIVSNQDTASLTLVDLDIVRADGNEFELIQEITSRGSSKQDAILGTKELQYKISQTDSSLALSNYFSILPNKKFRGQSVHLILKVPAGKSVYLGNDLDLLLHDIKNITNTFDDDMTEKFWMMTGGGLECTSCNPNYKSEHNQKEETTIQVSVNGKEVKIDKNGDTAHHENVNIHIGK